MQNGRAKPSKATLGGSQKAAGEKLKLGKQKAERGGRDYGTTGPLKPQVTRGYPEATLRLSGSQPVGTQKPP
jgi:hypothetical protein